jgi:AcrR family transcriptional regulator
LQTLAEMLQHPKGERITTALLAARLEVSEAALYRHFASKAQMFEGLIEFIEGSVFGLINQIETEQEQGLAQLRAILAMLLSGQLPFDANALPAWMYHAQVPPPHFVFNPNLPGLTWVDLVFPFFLFAMGASFPLALSRRMESQAPPWKLFLFVAERGFLLGFFALFVQLIRPYTLNPHPAAATWLAALLGFFIFFPILTRLPEGWSRMRKISIRAAGWLAAIVFCLCAVYPDGSGFKVTRSDIIIVVLTNMAVFGSLLWMATRDNLALRLGVFQQVHNNYPQPQAVQRQKMLQLGVRAQPDIASAQRLAYL